MLINVHFRKAVHAPPPQSDSSDETKQRIKQVMSQSRYTADTKALDLRKFYSDPSFLGEPIYAALNRSDTMKEVVRIIGDNIPDLAAIELSSNHLAILGDLEVLTERAPGVTILHLSSNYVSQPTCLSRIRFDFELPTLLIFPQSAY